MIEKPGNESFKPKRDNRSTPIKDKTAVTSDIDRITNRIIANENELKRKVKFINKDIKNIRKVTDTLRIDVASAYNEATDTRLALTRQKYDIDSKIDDLSKKLKLVYTLFFITAVLLAVILANLVMTITSRAEVEPKTTIQTEIDGQDMTLYVAEDDSIYYDAALTEEFPNDNQEAWKYTGDPNNMFLMPYTN